MEHFGIFNYRFLVFEARKLFQIQLQMWNSKASRFLSARNWKIWKYFMCCMFRSQFTVCGRSQNKTKAREKLRQPVSWGQYMSSERSSECPVVFTGTRTPPPPACVTDAAQTTFPDSPSPPLHTFRPPPPAAWVSPPWRLVHRQRSLFIYCM